MPTTTTPHENIPGNKTFPSIFNDVLGPVMRGPSSSHSAAANRMGRLARALTAGRPAKLVAIYDPNGSLVTTHKDQGTDLGLYSGLLGWEPDDVRLPTYPEALEKEGISVEVKYLSYDAPHPNFYRLELTDKDGTPCLFEAISTGGGMIELQAIDGIPLAGCGDLHTTLLWLDRAPDESRLPECTAASECESFSWHAGPGQGGILRFDSRAALSELAVKELETTHAPRRLRCLPAVLPVLSRRDLAVPFTRCGEMLDHPDYQEKALWECAAEYEAARGGVPIEDILSQMKHLAETMAGAVDSGLKGTHYHDRILPSQSPAFAKAESSGTLIPGDAINRIIRYVSAIMEVKSSMGVIVAAPTAGSCGAMPGAVLALADSLQKSPEERAQAFLIAGLIGVFIARDATFSAEEGGCMAECGSGSAMAAAAIAHLAGGDNKCQLAAASMALQNCFGLACDPIANRVEAPCLGKNVMAATNALSCANMALAGYDPVVPLDEVIIAMNKVAHQIPRELRCTNLGGLSITPTAERITKKLADIPCACGSKAPDSVS